MSVSRFVIAAMAAMLWSPAFAQTDQQQQSDKPNPDEIVCRPGEPQVGSRIPGPRICHTQKEWDDIRQQAQDQLYHSQTQGRYEATGGGG